ncbi:MAG: VOC family protein [Rhodospirillaceae bacterium]|nr:VOC family protein [Rhodospirillaceae bacterium]
MVGDIIAPEGAPLSAAVIGVADLAKSLSFYRDIIGLTTSSPVTWEGEAFEKLWHLPPGSQAIAVFCELPGCPAGRVLLLDFKAPKRKLIRPAGATQIFGLMNLNFYTDDIAGDAKRLAAKGYAFWSDPQRYVMSSAAGTPTEVIFEGPDGVPINLVQLTSTDLNTRVGQMNAYVRAHGRTPTGFTPVVTSAHGVRNMDKAVAFAEKVCKSGILIDVVMAAPEQNHFLRLPPKAKTAVKFVQGNHMFGKIALCQPLNYPATDLAATAAAPHIGYIAQAFVVKNLAETQAAADALRCEVYSAPLDIAIPGVGPARSMIVRNPGSGALQQLIQPL